MKYCTLADIQRGTEIYVYQAVTADGEPIGPIDLADAREAVGMSDTWYWFCPHDDFHEWAEVLQHLKEEALAALAAAREGKK